MGFVNVSTVDTFAFVPFSINQRDADKILPVD
jgi:hypothetical protein